LKGPSGILHRSFPSGPNEIKPKSVKKTKTFLPSLVGLGEAGPFAWCRINWRARNFAAPVDPAAGAIEADGEELAVIVYGGDENAIANQDRRRVPGRQVCLPDDILIGSKLDRQVPVIGHAGGVRTPELRPVIGAEQRG